MRYKKKNTMRSPEEKEAIVLEYLNDKHSSYRKTADKYGIALNTKPHISTKLTWGIDAFLNCLLFVD